MDMMKPRIHYFKDLKNHTYFFEEPTYSDKRAQKFLKKLSQPDEVKIEILQDLITLLEKHQESVDKELQDLISNDTINKICSMYLYENADRGWENQDVFFLLRYAISGNPVGAPTGEIGEVIGLN